MGKRIFICRECGYGFPEELSELIENKVQVYCEMCGTPFSLAGVEFKPVPSKVTKVSKSKPSRSLFTEQNNSKLHLNIGSIYHRQMQLKRSLNHFKIASNHSLIGKIQYNLTLPVIYRTENEIAYYRERFSKGLHQIIVEADLSTPKALDQYAHVIKSFTPFYLQYQGKNDIDLQKKYGKFVCQIMSAKYPQWVKKRKMVPLASKERLRIGYLSSYMQSHSVGKFIVGWYRYHNRNRIKIYSYYINRKTDALTDEYRQKSDVFHHLPDNIETVARQIEKDNLHFLISANSDNILV